MRLGPAWNRFWFEPQSTAPLALFRIAFGLVVFAWTLSLAPDLLDFYSRDGLLSAQPGRFPKWGILDLDSGEPTVWALWVLLLTGSLCLTVGFFSRLAALVVWVGLLSFERRNPYVNNSGDLLLRVLAFYLVFAPSGAALSLDRLRVARERFWEFPRRSPWAIRLVQVQLSVIYLTAVYAKSRGATWLDGDAVSYALRLEDLERFPVPASIESSPTASAVFSWGTLAVEGALGVLVWTRLRPYVLFAGVGLHLGIDYAMTVGFFTPVILVSYLAFLSPQRAERLVVRARDSLLLRKTLATR